MEIGAYDRVQLIVDIGLALCAAPREIASSVFAV